MKKKRNLFSKSALAFILTSPSVLILPLSASADGVSVNFENPPYTTTDSINNQDGWISYGSAEISCAGAVYDHAVVANIYRYATFGGQSLRISDAVTSDCFGDQTFSKPLGDAVGETLATTVSPFPVGTRLRHFETQFDIASTMLEWQPGMHVSVSPDRGDGSRMSYLRFEDSKAGIDVFFDDVQSTSDPAYFTERLVAKGLSRAMAHIVKLTMDVIDGPSNDVVKVYIDGVLVQTGTSWENYYRYASEASAEPTPRIVRTVLFRSSGIANLTDQGKGFLFDNLSIFSGPILIGPPTNQGQCKNRGWKAFTNPVFENQGQCVSFVENINAHDYSHCDFNKQGNGDGNSHVYNHKRD